MKLVFGSHVHIIAEAGVNHNGDVSLGLQLIDVAARAGADAVKVQTFSAGRLVTRSAPVVTYQNQNAGETSQHSMLSRLELSEEAHLTFRNRCIEMGIAFVSTPMDPVAVEILDRIGVPYFKVGSGDLTNTPLLSRIAAKNRPVVLSTGMGTLAEVEEAVSVFERHRVPELVLLHCTTNYPTVPADVNLRAMETLRSAFGYPVGYSDHTDGWEITVAAVALGAVVIEKHFTLDRSLPGPDHKASLEPDELTSMVRAIRNVELALGSGRKRPVSNEDEVRALARRGVVANEDLAAGTTLTVEMVDLKRPATGLAPKHLAEILGRRLRRDVKADEPLTWFDVE